jgi:hypothetical protein
MQTMQAQIWPEESFVVSMLDGNLMAKLQKKILLQYQESNAILF